MNARPEGAGARACWFVGASYGPNHQTPRFLEQGIWENGYQDRYIDAVKSMQVAGRSRRSAQARRAACAVRTARPHLTPGMGAHPSEGRIQVAKTTLTHRLGLRVSLRPCPQLTPLLLEAAEARPPAGFHTV